ncbi:sugar ABC transporter permease [Bacillus tianshenii]|uniref:carbohydrate ABC transporter permease n=1 Tax=Sutcliffiella tianshenii TaxID=1463404 RepID=UPI001CD589D6|nr:sugar ABC transporter permease [Bacillus tianshenii]MCA1320471.1 sugar ABC transporter permease [Bacillus tianshenii]
MIPLTLFWIYPMIYSFYLSLTDWDYMSLDYNFIGLENYIDLFTSSAFFSVLIKTLYFCIGVVFPSVLGGLLLALLLNSNEKGMGLYRTFIFSPWITPMVAVAIVWSWIFEPRMGFANFLLESVNLPGLGWTSSTDWAMPAVIIVTVWKGLGWSMIFYLNALRRVPANLYEAASLDGATGLKKFLYVTIPLVSPTSLFLIIITTIDSLQAYDQIQILTQGGPAGSTRTILYMYYQTAFEEFNVGKATAVATVLLIITGLLSLMQFILSKRWVHYD